MDLEQFSNRIKAACKKAGINPRTPLAQVELNLAGLPDDTEFHVDLDDRGKVLISIVDQSRQRGE